MAPLCAHRVCHLGEGSLGGLYSRRPYILQTTELLVPSTPRPRYIPSFEPSSAGMLLRTYQRCFWKPRYDSHCGKNLVYGQKRSENVKNRKNGAIKNFLCHKPAGQFKSPPNMMSKDVKNRKNKSEKCQKSQK